MMNFGHKQDANFVRSQWSPNFVFAITVRAMSGNQQRKKQKSFEQHRSGDARLGLSGRQRLGRLSQDSGFVPTFQMAILI